MYCVLMYRHYSRRLVRSGIDIADQLILLECPMNVCGEVRLESGVKYLVVVDAVTFISTSLHLS
jgi:hypothetical protein